MRLLCVQCPHAGGRVARLCVKLLESGLWGLLWEWMVSLEVSGILE